MPSEEFDYKYAVRDNVAPNCCCCKIMSDEFERDTVNQYGERYQFARVYFDGEPIQPEDFEWPGLIQYNDVNAADWSIVDGALTCSTAYSACRVAAYSEVWNAGSMGIGCDVAWCFDLTFTGSGQVFIGYHLCLEYDNGRIRIRSQGNVTNDDLGFYFDYPLASGTTYRMRVLCAGGGIELWIDDTQVIQYSYPYFVQSIYLLNWYFSGGGTLQIDNLAGYKINSSGPNFPGTVGYPFCWPTGPCWFPWLDDGTGENPPQIQLEYTTNVTDCRPCVGFDIPKTIGGSQTVIMDLVECNNSSPWQNGCACYEAQGSFGCFNLLGLKISRGYEIVMHFCQYGEGEYGGNTINCGTFGGQPFPDRFWGLYDPTPSVLDDYENDNKLFWHGNTDTLTGGYPKPGAPLSNTTCGITSFTITIP